MNTSEIQQIRSNTSVVKSSSIGIQTSMSESHIKKTLDASYFTRKTSHNPILAVKYLSNKFHSSNKTREIEDPLGSLSISKISDKELSDASSIDIFVKPKFQPNERVSKDIHKQKEKKNYFRVIRAFKKNMPPMFIRYKDDLPSITDEPYFLNN